MEQSARREKYLKPKKVRACRRSSIMPAEPDIFLTEGFEAVSACVKANDSLRELDRSFAENNIFGIEKDYRLARVSKISLFMHGAGEGNIIFGDGLENYPDKNIKPNTFDILVANPPYSVSAFKPHLKLKNNSFSILDTISNNGSEIETLFVERISQLFETERSGGGYFAEQYIE